MRHARIAVVTLALGLGVVSEAAASPGAIPEVKSLPGPARSARSGYQITSDPTTTLVSSRSGVRFKTAAAADTFCLYGGPGTTEGKFQDAGGAPDRGGWTSVDLTEEPVYWQVSTFNAANLNNHGSGNLAAWCGQSAEQQPGWSAPPGYGNNWSEALTWTSGPLANPSVGQAVGLQFFFNHETEPSYDHLLVQYESNFVWNTVFSIDGTNQSGGVFAVPGIHYPADVTVDPILYAGNDYGGNSQNEIRIRLVVSSDGAYSNEDGFFPSQAGAAQVDDIRVTYDDGSGAVVSFSDFDTASDWIPEIKPYVGDFSEVHARLRDIDPCRENRTPAMGFVDYGQCPRNGVNNSGEPPCESTGGTQSPTWSYGVPGGWVVNYRGGLSLGLKYLDNEIWSPPIAWDLPGTEDDGIEVSGAQLRFSVWRHLPVLNMIVYTWAVRSSTDGGVTWSDFEDRGNWYYGTDPTWFQHRTIITDLIPPGVTHVQLSLGVEDRGYVLDPPPTDATPAPFFDDVALSKFAIRGPVISTRERHLFQDSFAQSGNADYATLAGRQDSDVRLDMAMDVHSSSTIITPGDSLVVNVVPTIPGTTVDEIKMVWILDKNPQFDDVRVMPPGTTVIPSGALAGWDQWTGEFAAQQVVNVGIPVPDRYLFDPPDVDFMHPGDVLRYYVWASDTDGRESTLPADIGGFETGWTYYGLPYDTRFVVHALPSVVDDGIGGLVQPLILVINGFGHRGGENDLDFAFRFNGWRQGIEYEVYTVKAPTSRVSNGIGSAGAHGAFPPQLSGYEVVLYLSGDLPHTLSDGTWTGLNDKGDDIGVLTSWFNQDGHRAIAHFGDDVANSLVSSSAGLTYLQTVLGVEFFGDDVHPFIGGLTAPLVAPAAAVSCYDFDPYLAFGGCVGVEEFVPEGINPPDLMGIKNFDNIGPHPAATGAVVSHQFLDTSGLPFPGPGLAASVLWTRLDGNSNEKSTATFPYGLVHVWTESGSEREGPNPPPVYYTSRAELVKEILESCFGLNLGPSGGPIAVDDATVFHGIRRFGVSPNPFNPATRIAFELGARSHVAVTVYNLRGERVATLADRVMDAGPVRLVWNGRDGRDAAVASGVYLVKATGDGMSRVTKVALVR